MNQFLTQVKELGSILAPLTACGYISGYLSMRAKAHALGTNPAFKLVDEAYVFAGFRILLVTLIVLLLSAPLLFAVRIGSHWLAARLSRGVSTGLEWTLLAGVVGLTLSNLRILAVGGLLLASAKTGASTSGLPRAIIDGTGAVGWIFLTTLLPVACSIWLFDRIRTQPGAFEWMLGLALAVQVCVLPIYHGALFADRKARVLATKPPELGQLVEPVAIVDQSSEHATLYGLDATGAPSLTVVAVDDLNKHQVTRIVPLEEFIRELTRSAHGTARTEVEPLSPTYFTDGTPSGGAKRAVKTKTAKDGTPAKAKANGTFLSQVVDMLRITFEGIGSLGESPITEGQLWEARLDPAGKVVSRQRIGAASQLSWPVSAPATTTIWAIQAGRLVSVKPDGTVVPHANDAHWQKLIGVAPDGSVFGFVLDAAKATPAILRVNGELERGVANDTAEDATKLAKLQDETRSYADQRTLSVDRSERGGRGFDVYLSATSQRVNVSDCGDDKCGHASMAREPDRVLYVRSPRY